MSWVLVFSCGHGLWGPRCGTDGFYWRASSQSSVSKELRFSIGIVAATSSDGPYYSFTASYRVAETAANCCTSADMPAPRLRGIKWRLCASSFHGPECDIPYQASRCLMKPRRTPRIRRRGVARFNLGAAKAEALRRRASALDAQARRAADQSASPRHSKAVASRAIPGQGPGSPEKHGAAF